MKPSTMQPPVLPPSPLRSEAMPTGLVRPQTTRVAPRSTIHFSVTPQLPEVMTFAADAGWLAQGFSVLSIRWLELRYSTDGWKTVQVLRSTDVPCPVVDGRFFLPELPADTEVEFAVHVGVACHAPQDTAGIRAQGDFWMNNGGQNYRQRSR
jgi:hypothetical protein